MKVLKLVPLIVLFFFAPGHKIYAQSRDYVITNKGDTLKGQFTSGRRFKADGWDKAKRIKVDEYKEMFQADDSVYSRAVFLPGSNIPEFVTMYEKGKIDLYTKLVYQQTAVPYQPAGSPGNLYGFNDKYYVGHLYVAKGNDSLKELVYAQIFKSSKKMEVLGELLMDNKDVYDKFIADDKFTPKQIRNIIHLCNTGKPYVEMHRPQPKEDASNDFNPSQN